MWISSQGEGYSRVSGMKASLTHGRHPAALLCSLQTGDTMGLPFEAQSANVCGSHARTHACTYTHTDTHTHTNATYTHRRVHERAHTRQVYRYR